MEQAMQEEHRQDLEALERLKRYLHNGGGGGAQEQAGRLHSLDRAAFGLDDDEETETSTLTGKVEEVFNQNPTARWTVPKMLHYLREIRFELKAQKPQASVGLIFQKLRKRGSIRIVKRGSGRSPNIYMWVQQDAAANETGRPAAARS